MGGGDRKGCRSAPRGQPGGSAAAAVALTALGWIASCSTDAPQPWLRAVEGDTLPARHVATEPLSGHGIGLEDLDADGLLDVIVTTGRGPVHAFRNDGALRFTDVTEAWGLAGLDGQNAVAVRDVDGDRVPDVVLAGDGGVRLFRNDGSGRTTEVTAAVGLAGVTAMRPVHVLAADLDLDGRVDLYVSSYLGPNLFLRQQGDGTFVESAATAGIAGDDQSWCAALWDADDDGTDELFVATDTFEEDVLGGPEWSAERTSPSSDRLYRRDPVAPGAVFTDVSAEVHLDVPRSTMGALVADLHPDGRLDMFTSDFGRNHALRMGDGGSLDHATEALGLDGFLRADCAREDDPSFCALVSWGAARLDGDGDGIEDMIVANGGLEVDERGPQPLSAYRGTEDGTYEVVDLGVAPAQARALVAADLDEDGDSDAIVSTWNGPLVLLEGTGGPRGGYLRVRLRGRAAGAVVRLERDDGVEQVASVASGGIVQSSRPAEVTFGLGDSRPVAVQVRWRSGAAERVEAPPVGGGTVDLYEP